jgi:CheY-like chemotaxis protein
VPADLPLLAIDSAVLQTVLGELVNNTREATKDHGTLTIRARVVDLTDADQGTMLGAFKPGEHVELTLSDDGPGFPADAQAKVFREIFFSTKPRHRGLGYLVVYGIMQRFQGGLRWLEPAKGAGATVQLYLPVAALGTPAPVRADAPHLLAVHDDPSLLESIRRILEAQGWRVTTASSSASALSAVQTPKQSFDLVLADVLMPGVSGFDLARRILDYDTSAHFLFLYTQSSFHGLPEEDMLRRFTLLRWPIEASVFVKAVQAALQRAASKPDR